MPGLTELTAQEILNRCFNPNTNQLNTSIRTITVPSGDTSPGLAITPQGTNPAIRIYNPGSSGLEYIDFLWDTNIAYINTNVSPNGTGRSLSLGNARGGDYLVFNANGALAFKSYNNGDITLTPNGTGKVGIGIAPRTALYTNGTIQVTDGGTTERSLGLSIDGTSGNIGMSYWGAGTYFPIYIYTSGLARMSIGVDGKVGIGVTSASEQLHVDDAIAISNDAEGSTGRLTRRSARFITAALSGANVNVATQIPSGARLLAVQFCVNVEITGATSWSAAFNTGSTTSLGSGYGLTVNTKVNKQIVDEITTGLTDITLTAAGSNFTAGVIEGIVYYEELTSMANV